MDHDKNKSHLEILFNLLKQKEVSRINPQLLDASRKDFYEKWENWCKVCDDKQNRSINDRIILDFIDKLANSLSTSTWAISAGDINKAESEYEYLKKYSSLSDKIKHPSQTMDHRNPKNSPGKVTGREREKKCQPDKSFNKQALHKKKTNDTTELNHASLSTEPEEQGPDLEEGNALPREIQNSVGKSHASVSHLNLKTVGIAENTSNDKGRHAKREDVASLSQDRDPSDISRSYKELFDATWKSVFDVIKEKNGRSASIKYLEGILRAAYDTSSQHADYQIEQMVKEASRAVRGKKSEPSKTLARGDEGLLKEYRRRNAALSLPYLKKIYNEKHLPQLRKKWPIPEDQSSNKHVHAFACRCIEVSWYACIQDPPMVIEFDYKPKSVDDLNQTFTPFKSGHEGKRIQYIVWPPLRLHKDGPVMNKGVADLM